MAGEKQYQGSSGTPITYPRASRQTTEESPRYASTQTSSKPIPPVLDGDENPDAWRMPRQHNSSIDYRKRTRDMGNPKRTQRVRDRRPFIARLLIIVGFSLFVLAFGIMAFNALANWWQRHTDDVT